MAFPPDPELRCILGHTRWSLREAHSVREAEALLRQLHAPVLIAEPKLPDGTWIDLLELTLTLTPVPPLVVAAHHADEDLWMQVLNRGGYNVISKPYSSRELVQTVSLAWLRSRDAARTATRASAP